MPKVSEAYRESRRDQIAQAAARCFDRNGFHATTMDQIISEAGLSAGAVYRYFPSKEAIILHVASTGATILATFVATEALTEDPDPPLATFTRAMNELARFMTRGPQADLARIALQGWAETPRNPQLRELMRGQFDAIAQTLTELLTRWRERGDIEPTVDPVLAAKPLLAMALGFMVQRVILDDLDPTSYAEGMASLISVPQAAAPPSSAAPIAPAVRPSAARPRTGPHAR
jgi:AcrR family transcriptional regulator